KTNTVPQLFHPIHSILNTDPSVATDRLQFTENSIVAIQALTNSSMPQAFCVTFCPAFLTAQILQRAFGKISVTRMHGDDPLFHTTEQIHRLFTRKVGITWVEVHSKMRMLYPLYQFTKDCLLLRKLRVCPEIIFVVVFQYQG